MINRYYRVVCKDCGIVEYYRNQKTNHTCSDCGSHNTVGKRVFFPTAEQKNRAYLNFTYNKK